jgi:hypothetical protein
MRIANVAVSLPLPGISSGGPYGHPGLARAPPRGRHDREHLQAGSLHGEILMLRQNGRPFQLPVRYQSAMRFYGWSDHGRPTGEASLPYAASAWRGGQPALGMV